MATRSAGAWERWNRGAVARQNGHEKAREGAKKRAQRSEFRVQRWGGTGQGAKTFEPPRSPWILVAVDVDRCRFRLRPDGWRLKAEGAEAVISCQVAKAFEQERTEGAEGMGEAVSG